jgi:MFS family permease
LSKLRPRWYYGYIIVAAALVIQLVGWGIFGCFGVFINELENKLGWSRASISGVTSVILLVHGFFSILVGRSSDRYGPRIVMTICTIVYALGIFFTSRITSLWQLYLTWGVIAGIGVSAFDVVVLSTIARWFSNTRGFINGIVKAGAGLGHLSMPVIAGALILTKDWRFAFIILAIICLVPVVIASQFLRLTPTAKGTLNESNSPSNNDSKSIEKGTSLREATTHRQFWFLLIAYSAILFSTYTIQIHIAPHTIDLGNSLTQAAGMLSVIGASSIIGRFGMGVIGDKIGTVKTMMICCAILGVTLLCLSFIKQTWILYLVLPVYGLGHGGALSIISPLVASLFGTSSHGAIYGVIIFGGTIGGALGPLLAGSIFDRTDSYSTVFLILAATALIAFAFIATLRPLVAKE